MTVNWPKGLNNALKMMFLPIFQNILLMLDNPVSMSLLTSILCMTYFHKLFKPFSNFFFKIKRLAFNTRVCTLRFTVYFGSIRCNTVKADICWRGYPFMKPKNPGMVSVLSLCVGLRQTAGIIPQNPLESDVTGSNGFYGRGDLAPIMSATSRRPTQTDADMHETCETIWSFARGEGPCPRMSAANRGGSYHKIRQNQQCYPGPGANPSSPSASG